MRKLHSIRSEEIPLSIGRYRYYINDEPTGDIETWQITRLPDGTRIVRADLDGSAAGRGGLISHLQYHPDGRSAWLRLRYRSNGVNAAAQYTFKPDSVRVARQLEDHPPRIEIISLDEGYLITYHTMISYIDICESVASVDSSEQSRPMFSPDLWQPSAETMKGRALICQVRNQGASEIEIPAGKFPDAQHFSVVFDDGVSVEAWYDKRGTPLRWFYPTKGYDLLLTAIRYTAEY